MGNCTQVRIAGAAIGEVRISWSWRRLLFGRLFGRNPGIELRIDGLYVVLATSEAQPAAYDAAEEASVAAEARQGEIEALEFDLAALLSPGWPQRAVLAALHKVYASVSNVHVRFLPPGGTAAGGADVEPATVGVTLSSLHLADADDDERATSAPTHRLEGLAASWRDDALLCRSVRLEGLGAYVRMGSDGAPASTWSEWESRMRPAVDDDDAHGAMRARLEARLDVQVRRVDQMSHPFLATQLLVPHIAASFDGRALLPIAALGNELDLWARRHDMREFARPAGSVSADARGWWRYARECVHARRVVPELARRRGAWAAARMDWRSLCARRAHRREYVRAFCAAKTRRASLAAVAPLEALGLPFLEPAVIAFECLLTKTLSRILDQLIFF